MIPINIEGTHWFLAVVFMEKMKVQIYDSLPSCAKYDAWGRTHESFLDSIRTYLEEEHKVRCEGASLPKEWTFHPCPGGNTIVPEQGDTNDCGVFVCFMMDLIMDDCPVTHLTQEAIEKHGREWICATIMNNEFKY